jgi:hypothetical protein
MRMNTLLHILPFVGIFGLFGLAMWLLVRWERKQANAWTPVADGDLDRAEYGHYFALSRSGAMVHTTSYHRIDVTTVFFQDGRSYVMDGLKNMPYPRGTKVRIMRNGQGNHRLDRLS